MYEVKYLNETEKLAQFTIDIETDQVKFEKVLKAFFADGPNFNQYLKQKSI